MIHYHGTPISGGKVSAAKFLVGRHALVSHHHPEQIEVVAEACHSFVLDNGAFSHFRGGSAKVEWSDYYTWCERWLALPTCDWALIPDVIGGTAEQNDALLREWPHGKSLGVPVYHFHEPVERLAQLATEWPRVALGSSGDYWQVGAPIWWRRMDEIMEAVCDSDGTPRCRLHGLRMLDPDVFRWLPVASADSVNCGMNGGRKGESEGVDCASGSMIIAMKVEANNSARRWTGGPSLEVRCDPVRSQQLLNFDDSSDGMAHGCLSSGIGAPVRPGAGRTPVVTEATL